ncbi:hypothetical protein EC991_003076 [Linnemannia zychae]|nr:hypothetical protein EC991_003076 [Linnemannia zychae]
MVVATIIAIEAETELQKALEALELATAAQVMLVALLKHVSDTYASGGYSQQVAQLLKALKIVHTDNKACRAALLSVQTGTAAKCRVEVSDVTIKYEQCHAALGSGLNNTSGDPNCTNALTKCQADFGVAQQIGTAAKEALRKCLDSEAIYQNRVKLLESELEKCQANDTKCHNDLDRCTQLQEQYKDALATGGTDCQKKLIDANDTAQQCKDALATGGTNCQKKLVDANYKARLCKGALENEAKAGQQCKADLANGLVVGQQCNADLKTCLAKLPSNPFSGTPRLL